MKTLKSCAIAILAASIAFVSCGQSSTKSSTSAVKAPTKALVDSASYLMGVNFGGFIKGYELGEINYDEMLKGMHDMANSKGSPRDSNFFKQFKISPQKMQAVLGKFIQERRAYMASKYEAKEKEVLAKYAKNPSFKKTAKGVYYKVLAPGSKEKITMQDTLFVHYKGTLVDGTVFDQVKKTAPSVKFTLNRVIPGWADGLQQIGDGGRIELVIPSELAYGKMGQPQAGIKPFSTLLFEVSVDSVKHFVAPKEVKKAEVKHAKKSHKK